MRSGEFCRATSDGLGHFELLVRISPDHLMQTHEFQYVIDQSYLQQAISECDAIIAKTGQ